MPRSFELTTISMVTPLTLSGGKWGGFFLNDIIISFVFYPLILVLLSPDHLTVSLTLSYMLESAGSITSSVMVESSIYLCKRPLDKHVCVRNGDHELT